MEAVHTPASIWHHRKQELSLKNGLVTQNQKNFSGLDTKCHTPCDKVYSSQYRMDVDTSVIIG